ncbi:hypothetical protein BDW69DRAFT_109890 [Aspergillus filifer]
MVSINPAPTEFTSAEHKSNGASSAVAANLLTSIEKDITTQPRPTSDTETPADKPSIQQVAPEAPSQDQISKDKSSTAREKADKKRTPLSVELAKEDEQENGYELYSEVQGWGDVDLDKCRQKARMRVMQSKAYIELVERRILELEGKVRKILREPTPVLEDDDESAFPGTIPDIRLLTWGEFAPLTELDRKKANRWKHRPELDLNPKNVIEVLQEEPRYGSRATKTSTNWNYADTALDLISKQPSKPFSSFVDYPNLIRIRSKELLHVVQEATGCQTKIGPHEHRMLLLRPFKLLVTYEPQLRQFLQKLDDLHKDNESQAQEMDQPQPAFQTSALKRVQGPANITETRNARDQLRLLCTLIDQHFKPQIELLRNLNPGSSTVTFHNLWYIFKPGYEVRTRSSRIQLYRVIKVNGGRDILSFDSGPDNPASLKLKEEGYSPGSFIVECFYVSFDGTRFGPVNVTFQIRKYEGEKEITSLPVFPLACDPNQEDVRKKLLKRGNTFAKLSSSLSTAHRKYRGPTLDAKRQEYVESEVVIDFRLAFLQKDIPKPEISIANLVDDDKRELFPPFLTLNCETQGCCGNDAVFNDYEIDEKERNDFQELKELSSSPDDPGSLKDDQKRLLPPEVYGFVLRTRRWATFDIELLEEPDYSNGWKNLVIKPDTKEMVLALVENHERPRGELGKVEGALPSVDLVQGKGKGLIILLHGEPGVGKTSTAECVAAHTKRPLFPITCGDIGEKADEVEDNLERNFQLAHKWGCVLLLDEAEYVLHFPCCQPALTDAPDSVFLSKRTSDDIQRNAIVSVFLRTLEYYSGILFLTTNRVGKIDRAFKSRIHLSIFYPKLDLPSTRQIWENNLETAKENLSKQNLRLIYEKDEILSFAEEHFKRLCRSKKRLRTWNGRQIRNAFQTAVAIAKYETSRVANATPNLVILSEKQFKIVADIAENFDTYLNTLHNGKNDADLAKGAQLRVDDYITESTQRGDGDRKKEKEREKASRNRSPSTDRRRHKRRRIEKQSESEESSSAYSTDSSEEDRRPSRKRREKRGHGRAR